MAIFSIKHKTSAPLTLGDQGEMLAAAYLEKQGYAIVEKNFKCLLGEIDLIAKKGKRIFFVEVKTRRSDAFGLPAEAVNLMKQKKLFKIAAWYQKERNNQQEPISFAVIAILWPEGKKPEVTFIPDAFMADNTF